MPQMPFKGRNRNEIMDTKRRHPNKRVSHAPLQMQRLR